jgi:hypothetical protein
MTELEYEKACRGPKVVLHDEFAWGDATYAGMSTLTNVLNPGTANESFQPTNINYRHGSKTAVFG